MSDNDPVTVAELLDTGVLGRAWTAGGLALETAVDAVRLVDSVEDIRTGVLRAAIVLSPTVARGGWTVEVAMRRAWERAAACVIAPEAAISAPSADLVARRLGIPLLAVRDDPREAALRAAAAVARPEAARSALTARCALRVAEAGASARSVLGVLNAELPGVQVALMSSAGELLAGRRSALAARTAGNPAVLEERVGGAGADELGRLVALPSPRSRGWDETVLGVLRIATGHLTAWAVTSRLRAERQPRVARALLSRILLRAGKGNEESTKDELTSRAESDVDGEEVEGSGQVEVAAAEAAAMGWPTSGPFLAVAVCPVSALRPGEVDRLHTQLCSSWAAAGMSGVLAPFGGLWVSVLAAPDTGERATRSTSGDDATVTRVERALRDLSTLVPAAAGLGAPVADLGELAHSVDTAAEAARAARQYGAGTALTAAEVGVRTLLVALPEQLTTTARHVLAGVVDADTDGTLVATLAAVLDEAGSPGGPIKRAAQALGVHRNTVTERLERLRSLGVDVSDPRQRLSLHLASHLLRPER